MKIFLGPAGNCMTAEEEGTIGSLSHVKKLGLHAQEIEFVRSVYMKNNTAQETGKEAERLGIRLSIHAPYFVNLCNPEKLEASMKRITDSAERGHHMNASVVVFHPGYYGKLEKKEALRRVKEACAEMGSLLRDNGWDVKLGPETTGKVSQFGTVDEILSICEDVKECVPVIDWSHLFAKYQGKPDFRGLLKSVTDAGFREIHTHFSNIEFTEKGERRHLTLDHRQPDFADVAKIILESDIKEITIISESPILEKDSLVMKNVLEELGHSF